MDHHEAGRQLPAQPAQGGGCEHDFPAIHFPHAHTYSHATHFAYARIHSHTCPYTPTTPQVWRATNQMKEELWRVYKEDPEEWTIMKLADHFQLNPHRVVAILKHMQIREDEAEREQMEANDPSIPEEKVGRRWFHR